MNIEVQVNQAVDEYEKSLIRTLSKMAITTSVMGQLQAISAINSMGGGTIYPNLKVITRYAQNQVAPYTKLLYSEGATMIQGNKVYWLKDYTAKARKDIIDKILNAVNTGQAYGVQSGLGNYPAGTLADDLSAYFNAMRNHAEMVARTEGKRVYHLAKKQRMFLQGVQQVKWYTHEPCDICAQFSGNTYYIDALPMEIPVHPRCRCDIVPVVKDIDQIIYELQTGGYA
jgi:SPP1 gp7 family putative phage head morphogenesis protein